MSTLPNSRHERFAQELAAGKSAAEAYRLAGYKDNRGNAAALQRNQHISTRVAEILSERQQIHAQATQEAVQRLALTKEWVLSRLMENAERAMQAECVRDDEGRPTGEYKYEGSVANRALELLGKDLGMFIDRREIGSPGEFDRMSDDELANEIRREAQEIVGAVPANGTQH